MHCGSWETHHVVTLRCIRGSTSRQTDAPSTPGRTRRCSSSTRRGRATGRSSVNATSIDRDYGSHALYDIGKTLVAGGGRPPTDTARVIDFNGNQATLAATPGRWPPRAASTTSPCSLTAVCSLPVASRPLRTWWISTTGVYPAELWNPATGQWSTLAAMRETRQYHSTALLLPDGRVLSSGGGVCGDCDVAGYLAKNAEVFTPPYLFKKDGSGQLAPRPTISSAPGVVNYGAPLQISTPNAASIGKVALVRLGAVTHSVNMEQRYIPLTINAAQRDADGHRARQRKHRPARPLHAVRDRRGRCALGCSHGHRGRRQPSAESQPGGGARRQSRPREPRR